MCGPGGSAARNRPCTAWSWRIWPESCRNVLSADWARLPPNRAVIARCPQDVQVVDAVRTREPHGRDAGAPGIRCGSLEATRTHSGQGPAQPLEQEEGHDSVQEASQDPAQEAERAPVRPSGTCRGYSSPVWPGCGKVGSGRGRWRAPGLAGIHDRCTRRRRRCQPARGPAQLAGPRAQVRRSRGTAADPSSRRRGPPRAGERVGPGASRQAPRTAGRSPNAAWPAATVG
jgi:hypothetical protein